MPDESSVFCNCDLPPNHERLFLKIVAQIVQPILQYRLCVVLSHRPLPRLVCRYHPFWFQIAAANHDFHDVLKTQDRERGWRKGPNEENLPLPRALSPTLSNNDGWESSRTIRALAKFGLTRSLSRKRRMAYRIYIKFKDGSAKGFLATEIEQPPPRYGDTISVERHGHEVSAYFCCLDTVAKISRLYSRRLNRVRGT